MIEVRDAFDTLEVSVDESNHGRFPEVFAAIFSFPLITQRVAPQREYQKIRKAPILEAEILDKDYRFGVVERKHYEKYGSILVPRIVTQLVESFPFKTDYYRIFIDGALKPWQLSLIQKGVSEAVDTPQRNVYVEAVPKRTRTRTSNYLVAVSDGLAGYLFYYLYTNKSSRRSQLRFSSSRADILRGAEVHSRKVEIAL